MASTAGRKLFVGSLPGGIHEDTIRAEFSRFGEVEDVFIKPGCEPGRQWSFVTMGAPDQAQSAKEQCDRILLFPGAERPCDVMVAKNQGLFGQPGELGSAAPVPGGYNGNQGLQADPFDQFAQTEPIKIFVGSLPDGILEPSIRDEYSKYGNVTDIFVKPGCESGRQWAFVSFQSPEEAAHAREMTNGILQFPGQLRSCEVTMARNQGLFGQGQIAAGPPRQGDPYAAQHSSAPKKIFVGSLPVGIPDSTLRSEFAKYGQITDVHINNKPCDNGRNWAFITFASPDQANLAKVSTDRMLFFPGADKACEVTLAKHQGLFGQEDISAGGAAAFGHPIGYAENAQAPSAYAPTKIFVGSLSATVDETQLRAEFSKYGQVVDVHVSTKPCEPGRNWAFVTLGSHQQAQYAKDSTDRQLIMPGNDRPCEVMLAKNQGKFGQDSSGGAQQAPAPQIYTVHAARQGHVIPPPPPGGQPPPPAAPPPSHLTPWRMYKTAAGLPYYHNSQTQVTQWECPPDLQVPGQNSVYPMHAQQHHPGAVRYAPY